MSKTTEASKSGPGSTSAATPIHPGKYVRDVVLAPRKLSVSAAAKLVGVGRPALSNFLNGHVSATPEMASRVEVAFSLPAEHLLGMQAAYDAAQAKSRRVPTNVVPYVAPFLGIKATDIEDWVARNISARNRLSVFLRTLVNSTVSGATKIDFPGNDDAERPGWDGYVEVAQATPWIPDGVSGWEFGTNQNVKSKAEGDFVKRTKGTTKDDRDLTSFMFVTPRHWPGKADWERDKRAMRQWKDVRAYDSSDLEQWLEQSIAAQTWFANETLRPSRGVRSLDKCWGDWANVASPPLAGSLFAPSIDGAKRTMLSRLSTRPYEPIIVAADSAEEALAFLAQLFGPAGDSELAAYRDRVLVFDQPGVLAELAQGSKDFIAVAASREVERELGTLARTIQTIIVYPRNAANVEPHMVLEPLNHEAFRSSLEEMGCGRDDVTKYDNESGRSLTVLRRRLANVPAICTPEWAENQQTAASLIPFLFIGAWDSTNTTDQTALALLADAWPYELLEKECQRLVSINDAPMWSVGSFRGVVSKIDLLFAIAGSITTYDLQRYFDVAKMVLGEDDPRLDLPEGERWAAAIYGKSRQFSGTLREGISETLVLLSVYGNRLFRPRLGFDCERAARDLVRELLTPLKTRILEANDGDLTAYAEAAPDEFLSILEEDLKTEQPETYGLMRPAGAGIFGGCPRAGILWALEGLAWNPDTLPRAAVILAQLAEIEINDNWGNKPIRSLESIFRVWMPQTAADHDTRLRVIKLLVDRYPKAAWTICIEQINTGQKVGQYSHKPSWRNEAHGFGEPPKTRGPILAFRREMVKMALTWNGGHTRSMLCDLIEHLYDLSEEHQQKVWNLLKSWAEANASDADKAFVREKIRVTIMSRRGVRRSKKSGFAQLPAVAKSLYQVLEPSDLLNKHEWLFRKQWVEESADELHGDHTDFRAREERITNFRTAALREILLARGLPGIFELAEMGDTALQIGWLTAKELLPGKQIPGFLLTALRGSTNSESWSKKNLVVGALRALHDEQKCVSVLRRAKRELPDADFVRLLLLAPFSRSTWEMVDELEEQHRQTYWKDVAPGWIRDAADENREAIERLLACQRPRAAFVCAHVELEDIGADLLFRLMSEIVKGGDDQPDYYQLDQYDIERAFALMNESPVLELEQKAGLEFAFIDALSNPLDRSEGNGIPNLEKYVEAHPELFVRAIVWGYNRRGEGEDPPEWKVASTDVQSFAERGHKLLNGLSRMPGHDDQEELRVERLAVWVKAVRDACEELGRLDVADICIGKFLSRAPVGEDGVWPCAPVRQVLEGVHSKEMMRGAHTGLYNSRGATWRGEGGDQERALAARYRVWANALQFSHPFLASELLMGMVKTYEDEASREDAAAGLRRRLR